MDTFIGIVTTTLFGLLFILPFITAASLVYLAKLVKDVVKPPILLVLLTGQSLVNLLASTYIAVLIVNTRYLGNVNPPELLPLTLLALIAPLAFINVIAFVLWRVRGGGSVPVKS